MFDIKLIKKKRKARTLFYKMLPIISLFMNTGSTVIA